MREYSSLTLAPLGPRARLAEPMTPGRVTLDDPAFSVMTDLREVSAATTTADEFIAAAEAQMVRRSVRLLFVLDAERKLAGIVTATDLLGEKPMRFMQSRGVTRTEIQVGDLMTPAAALEALSVMDVAQMRVGHIVATLKAVGRRHLIVAEDNGQRVRGLFSASQLARQLGVELQTIEVAQTFADIEAALVR
ncbi:MAG TPA: CBS domain-containing protein [Usitatibacter sp.]|jgi:CBS domain-containing protein|nr:CBS domain-containing protein [Usitatibacter sp.]